MRPLSAVPTRTLPPCGAGATAKAVIEGELHRTSVPPSGRMRKTALRAWARSLRLRACGCCAPCADEPESSMDVMVTVVVPCPLDESEDCGAGAAVELDPREVEAASDSASA